MFKGITQLSRYYTKFSHPAFDEMNLNNTHKSPAIITGLIKDYSLRAELNQKGWAEGWTRCTQGNKCKNVASCDTEIYSATGLEGGTELPLPALRS